MLPTKMLTINCFCTFYLNLHWHDYVFLIFKTHIFPSSKIQMFLQLHSTWIEIKFLTRGSYLKISQFGDATCSGSNSPGNCFPHLHPVETCKSSAVTSCGVDLFSFRPTQKVYSSVDQLYAESLPIWPTFSFLLLHKIKMFLIVSDILDLMKYSVY